MTPQPLSIVQGGLKNGEGGSQADSSREHMLIERLLALPAATKQKAEMPDDRLAQLASILLSSQLLLAEILGWELCYSPIQRILLLIYVRQAQHKYTSIQSLRDFPVVGPSTVALRWAAKLLHDGVLELTETAEENDRLIRVTSSGISGVEQWLRYIESEFMRSSASGFSV